MTASASSAFAAAALPVPMSNTSDGAPPMPPAPPPPEVEEAPRLLGREPRDALRRRAPSVFVQAAPIVDAKVRLMLGAPLAL